MREMGAATLFGSHLKDIEFILGLTYNLIMRSNFA